jgi:hypothetical protein
MQADEGLQGTLAIRSGDARTSISDNQHGA